MAKTWVPQNDTKAARKSAKAFAKAMRALQPKGRGRQHSRPR